MRSSSSWSTMRKTTLFQMSRMSCIWLSFRAICIKPGIAPTPVRLVNIGDIGPISSLAAWADPRGNQNIAILTTQQGSRSLSVYHARLAQPGTVRFLRSLAGTDTVDIAGEYLHTDDTNKLELAVSPEGSPSSMAMASWSSQIGPEQSNVQWNFASTNTPWVTNFPGPQATSQKILSLAGAAGINSGYAAWSKALVTTFIGDDNKLQIFSANNGGGTLAPGAFSPSGTLSSSRLRSVVNGGQIPTIFDSRRRILPS